MKTIFYDVTDIGTGTDNGSIESNKRREGDLLWLVVDVKTES